MFTAQWILQVAAKSPRVALTAVLMGCLAVSYTAISLQYKGRIDDLQGQITALKQTVQEKEARNMAQQTRMEYKDSLFNAKFLAYHEENSRRVQEFLEGVNRKQAEQIRKQAEVDRIRATITRKNQLIIQKSNAVIKNLEDAQ